MKQQETQTAKPLYDGHPVGKVFLALCDVFKCSCTVDGVLSCYECIDICPLKSDMYLLHKDVNLLHDNQGRLVEM